VTLLVLHFRPVFEEECLSFSCGEKCHCPGSSRCTRLRRCCTCAMYPEHTLEIVSVTHAHFCCTEMAQSGGCGTRVVELIEGLAAGFFFALSAQHLLPDQRDTEDVRHRERPSPVSGGTISSGEQRSTECLVLVQPRAWSGVGCP
jgi:hypothetical protein